MKSSIVLIAVTCIVGVYSLSEEKIHQIHEDINNCVSQSGIDQTVLENLKKGIVPPPSRELDCFSACVLKKNRVMNQDGTINSKPDNSEAHTKCKSLRGKDECETGGKIMSCYYENKLIPKIHH